MYVYIWNYFLLEIWRLVPYTICNLISDFFLFLGIGELRPNWWITIECPCMAPTAGGVGWNGSLAITSTRRLLSN